MHNIALGPAQSVARVLPKLATLFLLSWSATNMLPMSAQEEQDVHSPSVREHAAAAAFTGTANAIPEVVGRILV